MNFKFTLSPKAVMKDDNWCQDLLNLLMCLALVYWLGWLQVSSKSFALYFLRETHLGICRNGIFCPGAKLFAFLASYLGTYCDSSNI